MVVFVYFIFFFVNQKKNSQTEQQVMQENKGKRMQVLMQNTNKRAYRRVSKLCMQK